MKQALVATTLFLASIVANSQENDRASTSATNYVVSAESLNRQLRDIMTATGLHADFILKKAKVRNIEASISRRKRYILYNPDFLNQVNAGMRSQWGSAALLAHEVGHHLSGHTIRRSGSTPAVELEADEFAGYVLQKLGATLPEAQAVIRLISRTKGSKTHPGRHDRETAIKTGWLKAEELAAKITRPAHRESSGGRSTGTAN